MTDYSKAEKAKLKAKSRKNFADAMANQAAILNQLALQEAAMEDGAINPETQVPVAAMQNMTQYVNPYGRVGTVSPNMYNPGNVVY